ncbi:MAG: flagellar hook-length control protein FliK [Pseudomonadaceae bacterium]|nr:flagellar hook-length control protein FliK [Pseudomonadaceae bacterium]
MLSALSAPVKTLKANTSLAADKQLPAADNTGLSVNKVSPAIDFAETLDHAQVNFLSAEDAASQVQVFVEDVVPPPNPGAAPDSVLNIVSTDTPVASEVNAAAISIGNELPENGKTAPVEVLSQSALGSTPSLIENYSVSQAYAQIEVHAEVDTQFSKDLPNSLAAAVLPEAVARVNESLQSNVKVTSVIPVGTKVDPDVKTQVTLPQDRSQMINNPAGLRSAQIAQPLTDETIKFNAESERNVVSADPQRGSEKPKLPAGSNTGNWNNLLSAGKTEVSEAELQTMSLKPRTAENKRDALNANPLESNPVPDKVALNQLVAGAVKSAYATSETKTPSETTTVSRNELSGPLMHPREPKVVTPERITADPLQVRADAQPVNTASLMQRHVEQRLANQGNETKRQPLEAASVLDTRGSTESSDRTFAAQAKIEPATPGVTKQAGAPAFSDSQMNSRQVDAAVQDQILRVMSRQALANGRLTLQLNPHELGSLDIEFSTEKGEVQVAILARESSTRDLLEASVARLRQSLQDGGVNVGQLDIRHGDRQGDERGARESMHQQRAADSSTPGSTHEEAAPASRIDQGGIHIYV